MSKIEVKFNRNRILYHYHYFPVLVDKVLNRMNRKHNNRLFSALKPLCNFRTRKNTGMRL